MARRTIAFVTLPIVALAAAAFGVVIASLVIGAREADDIALTRQRETIEHALNQHGLALARELRVQTVWTESYERTLARDTAWMRTFYGKYLTQLLGYDQIYVLAADDAPVFGFVPGDDTQANFAELAGGLQDLLKAVRDPAAELPTYNVVETAVRLGDGQVAQHRAVADVRAIDGRPATVVVSTIPARRRLFAATRARRCFWWLSRTSTRGSPSCSATTSAFRIWQWAAHGAPPGDDGEAGKVARRRARRAARLAQGSARSGVHPPRRARARHRAHPDRDADLPAHPVGQPAGQAAGRKRGARHRSRRAPIRSPACRTGSACARPSPDCSSQAKAKATSLGVLSVNIDQFKGINDAFGHGVGDAVLIATAKRLQRLLRPERYLGAAARRQLHHAGPRASSRGRSGTGRGCDCGSGRADRSGRHARVRHRLRWFRDRARATAIPAMNCCAAPTWRSTRPRR